MAKNSSRNSASSTIISMGVATRRNGNGCAIRSWQAAIGASIKRSVSSRARNRLLAGAGQGGHRRDRSEPGSGDCLYGRSGSRAPASDLAEIVGERARVRPRHSLESPGCRDKVADAVEITASTPAHTARMDSGSLRSPTEFDAACPAALGKHSVLCGQSLRSYENVHR